MNNIKDVIVVGNFIDVKTFFGIDLDKFFKEELKVFGLNPIKYIDADEDTNTIICINKENYEAKYFKFNSTSILPNGKEISDLKISLREIENPSKINLF